METENEEVDYKSMSDDEFLDGVCLILEYRGKSDVARRFRAAYYGLAADAVHSEESGQVLRAESPPREASNYDGSQYALYLDWVSDSPSGGSTSQPKDEYFRGVHDDTNN
jgi:hypothetical protein